MDHLSSRSAALIRRPAVTPEPAPTDHRQGREATRRSADAHSVLTPATMSPRLVDRHERRDRDLGSERARREPVGPDEIDAAIEVTGERIREVRPDRAHVLPIEEEEQPSDRGRQPLLVEGILGLLDEVVCEWR